jgi:hypothetical protein
MLEHFYQQSFLFYLMPCDLVACGLVLGELTGFVCLAYFVMSYVPWWLSPFLVFMFGAAWIILFEAATFDFVQHYGFLKGVIP